MIPIATLHDVPLEAIETVGWVFLQGSKPYQRIFEVAAKNAQPLLDAMRDQEAVELHLERDEGVLEVRGLTILSEAPPTHPDRMAFLVSDPRWKWKHKLVRRDYNVRRRVGEFRQLNQNELVPTDLAPVVQYAAFSLENPPVQAGQQGSVAWVAKEAFLDVLNEVTEGAFLAHDSDFGPSVDLDGLCLRDPGDNAIDRLCAFLPGVAVWVNEDGITETTNRWNGDEEDEIDHAGTPLEGYPLAVFVEKSATRSSEFHAFFQCEDELRLDFVDTGDVPQTIANTRRLENVMQLPDTITYVSGPLKGKTIAQGTWVPIDQYLFDAWNASQASLTIKSGPRTVPVPQWQFKKDNSNPGVRRLFIYPGGYNVFLEADPLNRILARRWGAFMQHYRQTFRIPRIWVDNAFSFQATTLSIIDPVNGTRAPSPVYADHCVIPGVKRIAMNAGDPALDYGINCYAFDRNEIPPTQLDPNLNPLSKGLLAPNAFLVVLDPDAFVFKLVFKPLGSHLNDAFTILPSALADTVSGETRMPKADLKAQLGGFLLHAGDGLSQYHRFSTVITLATASPQGLPGLHAVTVSPDDVKPLMTEAAARRFGPCHGPVHQEFVGAEVLTVRSCWQDSGAAEIEDSILRGHPRNPSRFLEPEHMKAVANAMAVRHWVTTTDRYEGAHVTAFSPGRRAVGAIRQVIHSLAEDGVFTTELDMRGDSQAPNWMAFLPETTRRKIFRKIQREPQT